MAKEIQFKTKRLLLTPTPLMNLEQEVLLMEEGEERQAYQQMLDCVRKKPQDWLWYTHWKITLRQDGTAIGDLCFKGPPQKGTVEWSYDLHEAYWSPGYMTEAARVMLDWAFCQKDVYAVEAEALADNAASHRVLTELDFKPIGTRGKESSRFRREKQVAHLSMVYLMLGMCCGISLGVSAGNISIGMLLGMAVGFVLGTVVDSIEKRHRRQVMTGEAENNLT